MFSVCNYFLNKNFVLPQLLQRGRRLYSEKATNVSASGAVLSGEFYLVQFWCLTHLGSW